MLKRPAAAGLPLGPRRPGYYATGARIGAKKSGTSGAERRRRGLVKKHPEAVVVAAGVARAAVELRSNGAHFISCDMHIYMCGRVCLPVAGQSMLALCSLDNCNPIETHLYDLSSLRFAFCVGVV